MNPNNPNQNQQNLAQPQQAQGISQPAQVQPQVIQDQNIAQAPNQIPQVPIQHSANPTPVSVGKPEMGSVVEANVDANLEKYVQNSESEPDLEEEVVNAGVENVNPEPQIHYSAQVAGVSKSIPDPDPAQKSTYAPPVFKDALEADKVANETSPDKSLAWIAREVSKNFKKAFGNKSQPTEA